MIPFVLFFLKFSKIIFCFCCCCCWLIHANTTLALSSRCFNKLLTAKLLNQGYRYHKLRKAFSKFYRRHSDLVSKFNVGLKSLLQQGLSEPEFYGDLVYKFRKIYACKDFNTQFRKIILRYKKIGYNINVIRQTACMVVNPITVNNLAALFNCTAAG